MPLKKVFSGKFECPECGQQFEATGVPDDELFCDECEDVELEEVEEDEIVEGEDEDDTVEEERD